MCYDIWENTVVGVSLTRFCSRYCHIAESLVTNLRCVSYREAVVRAERNSSSYHPLGFNEKPVSDDTAVVYCAPIEREGGCTRVASGSIVTPGKY